jgi:hypothetical protein
MELHAAVEVQLLAAAFLRLYFAQHSARHAYYTGLVTVVPIVVITDTQWKDWRTPGHVDENLIIIEKVEDVETVLVTQRVKLPRVTALDKKTYETTTKNLIQTAHTLLIKTLYNACDKQNGFKTFTTNPAYIAYKIEFDIIAKAILYEYHEHPVQNVHLLFLQVPQCLLYVLSPTSRRLIFNLVTVPPDTTLLLMILEWMLELNTSRKMLWNTCLSLQPEGSFSSNYCHSGSRGETEICLHRRA